MAAVTYDGVPSSQGGTIFKDVNFWLSSRVPMKKSLEMQITTNGGKVVPLEKRADILIADHAKPKLAPPGSYSWKFIEDSVKNGFIQVKDRYLIGLDPSLPRPVGGGGGTKLTRTPFTPSEDAIVAKWVLSHSNRTGNKIFQELESVYPRHTWQSWRNRFVKTLQPLPIEKLLHLADSAPEEPVRNEVQAKATPARATPKPARKEPTRPVERKPARQVKQRLSTVPESVTKPVAQPVAKPAAKPAAKPTAKPAGNPTTERNPSPTHDVVAEGQAAIESTDEEDPLESPRAMFYEDLEQYMATTGTEIKLEHTINDITVELFDLSVAVGSLQKEDDSQGLDETDWKTVAMILGFDTQDEHVTFRLKQCYDECLVEFLEAMAEFDEDEEDNEDEVEGDVPPEAELELDEQQGDLQESRGVSPLRESDWEEESPSRRVLAKPRPTYTRSSPPVGIKRPQLASSPGPKTKRRRTNKKTEIESTPDMEDRHARQVSSAQNLSPSFRKSLMRQEYVDASEASQQLPPLLDDEIQLDEPQGEDGTVTETQPSPSRQTQQLSPVLGTETPADLSPSQQIHFEALNPSPVAFDLDKARQPSKARNLGRSVSNPLQAAVAGPSNQRTANAGLQDSPNITSATKKKPPRRSLPTSFGAKSETLKKKSAAPRRTHAEASRKPAQPPASGKSNRLEIDKWIRHYESLGFSRAVVIEGLKRTTLTPGALAGLVMQKLQAGEDVPSHHEGIWTDRDDDELALLATVDVNRKPRGQAEQERHRKARKALKRLTNKHGSERMRLRSAFLEAQDTDEQGGFGG